MEKRYGPLKPFHLRQKNSITNGFCHSHAEMPTKIKIQTQQQVPFPKSRDLCWQ